MKFGARLAARVHAVGSPTCVGLDPHLERLPSAAALGDLGPDNREAVADAVREFCFGVIDVVADQVAAVKPQCAFFEAIGAPGVAALEAVVAYAGQAGLITIVDAKRGDIGSTAEAYARCILDDMGADSVTLSPYLGAESLAPFVKRCETGKGAFVLVRTSNPGSDAWQMGGPGCIAPKVADWISATNTEMGADPLGPIGAVIGATVPDEANTWRTRMDNAWFLVPGFGAQGAGPAEVRRHFRSDGSGALITSSRGVLFPKSGSDGPDFKDHVLRRAKQLVADVAPVYRRR